MKKLAKSLFIGIPGTYHICADKDGELHLFKGTKPNKHKEGYWYGELYKCEHIEYIHKVYTGKKKWKKAIYTFEV